METIGEPLAFATADAWRTWLEKNHANQNEVWVMISKSHSTFPSVTLDEATEEALCFGWIDSSMHPIDEERYALRYTPRRKGSRWSERNKARVSMLIEQGRMTEAGLAEVAEAKRSGRWDTARGSPPHRRSEEAR